MMPWSPQKKNVSLFCVKTKSLSCVISNVWLSSHFADIDLPCPLKYTIPEPPLFQLMIPLVWIYFLSPNSSDTLNFLLLSGEVVSTNWIVSNSNFFLTRLFGLSLSTDIFVRNFSRTNFLLAIILSSEPRFFQTSRSLPVSIICFICLNNLGSSDWVSHCANASPNNESFRVSTSFKSPSKTSSNSLDISTGFCPSLYN